MGILAKSTSVMYKASWREVSREHFTEDDYNIILNIEVVPGDYNAVRLMITYIDGGVQYFSIARDSCDVCIGETISPKRCSMITLKRLDSTCEKILVDAE